MTDNIWEVKDTKSLVHLIKKHPKKFVVLGITVDVTPVKKKFLIKNFLNSKHTSYPDVTFIYYEAPNADLGKKTSLLQEDKSLYPIVYHIFDVDNIMIEVINADEQSIYETFGRMTEYYENDKKLVVDNGANQFDNPPTDPFFEKKIDLLREMYHDYEVSLLENIKYRKDLEHSSNFPSMTNNDRLPSIEKDRLSPNENSISGDNEVSSCSDKSSSD